MKLIDIEVATINKSELRDMLSDMLSSDKKSTIAKINTEFIQRAMFDSNFRNTISRFNLRIADGRGVLWAAKYSKIPVIDNQFFRPIQAIWQMVYSGAAIIFNPKYIKNPIPESFPGIDAFKLMLSVAQKVKAGIFILGATDEVLNKSVTVLKSEFPEIIISGTLNGYDFQKDASINPVSIINSTDSKVLFVALGSPKQEQWISDNFNKLTKVRVAVGEGGTLDRIASPGNAAPKWINMMGVEWLWRLFLNKSKSDTGSRIKRVWNAVPVFIFEVVKWKIKNGASK